MMMILCTACLDHIVHRAHHGHVSIQNTTKTQKKKKTEHLPESFIKGARRRENSKFSRCSFILLLSRISQAQRTEIHKMKKNESHEKNTEFSSHGIQMAKDKSTVDSQRRSTVGQSERENEKSQAKRSGNGGEKWGRQSENKYERWRWMERNSCRNPFEKSSSVRFYGRSRLVEHVDHLLPMCPTMIDLWQIREKSTCWTLLIIFCLCPTNDRLVTNSERAIEQWKTEGLHIQPAEE